LNGKSFCKIRFIEFGLHQAQHLIRHSPLGENEKETEDFIKTYRKQLPEVQYKNIEALQLQLK